MSQESTSAVRRSGRGILYGMVGTGLLACIAGPMAVLMLLRFHNDQYLAEMGKNRDAFATLFDEIEEETGCWVLVTSGNRTREEQAALKKENASNAAAGRSRHERQRAMDVNLLCPTAGMVRKADSKERWEATGAPDIARARGFTWGGDYRSYHDPVHFER